MRPILEVQKLSKYFRVGTNFRPKKLRALDDVSFSLRSGQILALVGESGSGKSTVARIVARLVSASSGDILLDGQSVLSREPRGATLEYRSRVQMIFQDPFGSLNPVHTIRHHLARPLALHRKAKGRAELSAKVYELLTSVGLTPAAEFADKYPHQTSGGQRQRVAIARALAVDPQVILADEPVSMLDVSIRMGVLNLMERLKQERKIAFLYITHDIASARYIADEIMVMYAGQVVESAPSEDLISRPAHPYTRALLAAVPDPARFQQAETAAASPSAPQASSGEAPQAHPHAGLLSLIEPPRGCPFAPRCPNVMDVCTHDMPSVRYVTSGHAVRCHLHAPEPATSAVLDRGDT